MLINGRNKIYMFDRDNSVFKIPNLTFLHRKDFGRHLENTLLDGVSERDLFAKRSAAVTQPIWLLDRNSSWIWIRTLTRKYRVTSSTISSTSK